MQKISKNLIGQPDPFPPGAACSEAACSEAAAHVTWRHTLSSCFIWFLPFRSAHHPVHFISKAFSLQQFFEIVLHCFTRWGKGPIARPLPSLQAEATLPEQTIIMVAFWEVLVAIWIWMILSPESSLKATLHCPFQPVRKQSKNHSPITLRKK